jgi:hypothetical protein
LARHSTKQSKPSALKGGNIATPGAHDRGIRNALRLRRAPSKLRRSEFRFFTCYLSSFSGLDRTEGGPAKRSLATIEIKHNLLEKGSNMKSLRSRNARSGFLNAADGAALVITFILLTGASFSYAEPGNDNRAPEVPPALQVPDGNKVSFHAYAIGVQIYNATASANSPTGFTWTFSAPEAVLSDADGNVVGIHYAFAGPTRPAWESESGSRLVGARTVPPVIVNPNAIPWLILSAVPASTIGPGIFAQTTYIQRVNTTGGLAPATAPTQLGQESRVPYTAEYFFYRESKQ